MPSNIKGGISSLEEKSLGAIHKAGTTPIQGVLKYAERPTRKGLYFVDNWMGHLSIFAGYAAAGANVVLFQLGGGGVAGRTLLEGSPSVVAPFLWATANPKTYAAATDSIDFYSGTVIEGSETPEEAGERLYRTVVDIASGTLSRSETLHYAEPIDICSGAGLWTCATLSTTRIDPPDDRGASAVMFHPYLVGERAPQWDPELRASFVGASLDHGRGRFARPSTRGRPTPSGTPCPSCPRANRRAASSRWSGAARKARCGCRSSRMSWGGRSSSPRAWTLPTGALLRLVDIGLSDDEGRAGARVARRKRIAPQAELAAAYSDRYHAYVRVGEALAPLYHRHWAGVV